MLTTLDQATNVTVDELSNHQQSHLDCAIQKPVAAYHRRPTDENYSQLQRAYDFLSLRLFHGQLPQCLITYQRKPRTLGYFHQDRFATDDGTVYTDEIAINPSHVSISSSPTEHELIDVLSTLAHEMVHLWQHHFGMKKSTRGYHNREWGQKMKEIGLYPSNTGEVGGKETGYQMSHFIIEDDPFHVAAQELLATGFHISWIERQPYRKVTAGGNPDTTETPDSSNRAKFTCAKCGFNVWGKPSGRPVCGFCHPGPVMTKAMKSTDLEPSEGKGQRDGDLLLPTG